MVGPGQNSTYTILLCHGNAGNISNRVIPIKILHEQNFNIFIFDYQAYGLSEGSHSESRLYYDADGAWKYLLLDKNITPGKIIIWGTSLGGVVAA